MPSFIARRSPGSQPQPTRTSGRRQVFAGPGRRNVFNRDPTDQKDGDPNDLLSAGGRWTFVMGAARVSGYLLASTGEYTITTTEGGSGDSIPVYDEDELLERADRVNHPFWEDHNPNGIVHWTPGTFQYDRFYDNYVVGHAGDVVELGDNTGDFALYGSIPHIEFLESQASDATTTVERFVRGLIGLAIPMVPDSPLEIWGVLDASAGLLVSDYVTDSPFTVTGFDITGHSGLKTQLPPDVLGETADALSRTDIYTDDADDPDDPTLRRTVVAVADEAYSGTRSVHSGTTRGADGEADTLADTDYATSNAYRGRLTATVTIPLDVLSTGSLEYLIASGTAGGDATPAIDYFTGTSPYPVAAPIPNALATEAYTVKKLSTTTGELWTYNTTSLAATETAITFPASMTDWGQSVMGYLPDEGALVLFIKFGSGSGFTALGILDIATATIVADSFSVKGTMRGLGTDIQWKKRTGGTYLFFTHDGGGAATDEVTTLEYDPVAKSFSVYANTTSATIVDRIDVVTSDPTVDDDIFYAVLDDGSAPTPTWDIYTIDAATFALTQIVDYSDGQTSSPIDRIYVNGGDMWVFYQASSTTPKVEKRNATTGALVSTLDLGSGKNITSGTGPTNRGVNQSWTTIDGTYLIDTNNPNQNIEAVFVDLDAMTYEECDQAIFDTPLVGRETCMHSATASTFGRQDSSTEQNWRIYCGTQSAAIAAFTLGYWIEQFAINFLGWVEDTEIDASDLNDTLYGFQSDDLTFQRDMQNIREVFDFYIDDHTEPMTCKRATESATADVTLAITDLVRNEEGIYVQTRTAEEDSLPQAVQIEFTDAERLYIRRSAEPAIAENVDAISPNRVRKYSIPFAMLEADIKALQWKLLWNLRAAATTYSLTVRSKHLDITPGTTVSFPFSSTATYMGLGEVVSTTMIEGDMQQLDLRALAIDKAVTVDPAPIAPTTNAPSWSNQSTIYIHLDIPFQGAAANDQDGAGIVDYGVLTSDKPFVWDGGNLYRRDDANDNFVLIHDQTRSPWWGTVATPLGDYDYTQGMDETTTLVVQMVNGSLSQIGILNEQDTAGGLVKLAYGRPGRWELLYPRSMVHQGSGVVHVTDFYRGQEGTEWAISSHQAGDYCVMIDTGLMVEQTFANADINIVSGAVTSTRQYKATGYLQSPSAVTATTQALSGASHVPYAPEQFAAAYSSGSPSTLMLSCVRRDRFPPYDAFEAAPNSDRTDLESPPYNTFILRIYTTGTSPPDRTVTVTADDNPSWEYIDADQVTDFGAKLQVGDKITMSWRQVRIMDDGRELYGRKRTETVTVT